MANRKRTVFSTHTNLARYCALIALTAGALLAGVIAPPGDAQTNDGKPKAQFSREGTKRCLHCHAGERMVIMADTAHGNAENPHTPFAQEGCESCHGPGSLHVSRARGGIGFPEMLRFTDEEPAAPQNQACVKCHAEDMGELAGIAWTGSSHDNGEITCMACHEMHVVGMPLLEKDVQLKVCAGCHEEQIAEHRRFEDKGIIFDRLSCHDCHDQHQLVSGP